MSLLTDFLKLFKWNTSDSNDLEEEFDIDTAMNGNWDNINEFAKEIDSRVEKVEDASALQGELIQQLQSNMINETTEEATSLHVADAAELPARLKISSANETENIIVCNSNFLEKQGEKSVTWNGLNATVEEDGTIVLNGTVSQACYVQLISELILGNYSDTSNFKKNFIIPGSYQFSCDWEGEASSSNINAYLRTSAGTSTFNVQILNVNTISSHRYANFNVENVEEYIAYLWLPSGTTFTNFKMKFMAKLQSDTSDYVQNEQQEIETNNKELSIETYYKTTNIYTKNNTALMQLTYTVDTKSYIDSMIAGSEG